MALSVPQNITVGETIEIEVTGSSHAGEEVQVKVTDGHGNTQEISVQLDMDGNGTGTWTVEPWDSAIFSYSTCIDQVRTPAFAMT